MKYRRILLCLVFGGLSCSLLAQSNINNNPYGSNPNNFIPATPEATALQRYGDLPVSYQNGLPDISIPLGEITLKNFSWPISLSYHAGGNKVGDIASCVGLGWTLNSHGIYSSKIVGKPGSSDPGRRFLTLGSNYDEGDVFECDYIDEGDVNIAEEVVSGSEDFLPDFQYYNTPVFNLKAIGGMIFPATDMRGCSGNITIGGTSYSLGSGLQDTKGNRYFFSGPNTWNINSSTCYNASGTTINQGSVMSNILTYEGNLIAFSYDTAILSYNMPPTQYRTFAASSQCSRCNFEIGGASETCNNSYTGKEAYLSKIESSSGDIVKFYYSSRSDLTYGKKLDSVEFKRKVGGTEELLRKYKLTHAYYGSGANPEDYRLKLAELKLYDKSNNYINNYLFEYDATALPNRITSKAVDWWGYYNGQNGNSTLVADQANRDGNITYARAGVLNKITYPTGGSSSLDYEMNPFGGLRVKSIEDNDSTTSVVKKRSFNYHVAPGDGTNNGQVFEDYLTSNYFATNATTGAYDAQDESQIFLLNCYTKRVNSSPVTNTIMNLVEQQDYYGFVTEYHGIDSTNGKIDYFFGNTIRGTGNVFTPEYIQLIGKKIYKRTGGTFDLVSESANYYDSLYSDNSILFDDPVAPLENRIWVRDIVKTRDAFDYDLVFALGYKHWCKHFIDNEFCISSMPCYLTKQIEKTYAAGTNLVLIDTTKYFYDDTLNLQATRIQKINSKGDTITIKNSYVTGAIPTGVSLSQDEEDALDILNDQNITASPYYIEVKNNSTVISKQLKLYDDLQGLSLLKKEKDYPSGGSDYRETQFNLYDNRCNIVEFIGADKMTQAMIYDSSSNLTTHCAGSSLSHIASCSFETGTGGNWAGINSTYVQNSGGLTGNKYYNQTSFSLSKASLTSGNYYIVSYWSKNGSYTVSGNQSGYPKTITSVIKGGNTWTLYEHLVTGQTTITVSGTGAIDELRLFPKGAQMSTYAYDPSIGIVSTCNQNNQIAFYEYDDLGRLKTVKNENGEILKRADYQFRASNQQ